MWPLAAVIAFLTVALSGGKNARGWRRGDHSEQWWEGLGGRVYPGLRPRERALLVPESPGFPERFGRSSH